MPASVRKWIMPVSLKSTSRAIGRECLGACLAGALLLGARAVAQTGPDSLRFEVILGHDGLVREASWFPVVCECRNDGESFRGVIEITGSGNSQGLTRRTAIELPAGTLKRITIPVSCGSRNYSSWDVRLKDDRGQVRAEQRDLRPRRQLNRDAPLIAALPRSATGMPLLRPPLVQQEDLQPAVARWQTSLFPDNPLVLEGLDALYLNSQNVAGLSAGQVRAILAHVRGGGHLIVAVEEIGEVNASSWLKEVLPCELEAMAAVAKHPELQEWLQSSRSLKGTPVTAASVTGGSDSKSSSLLRTAPANAFAALPGDAAFEAASLQVSVGTLKDGQIVVSAEGKPLIVTATRGRGRVTALLFSPEREPARSWQNLPSFWSKLIEVPQSLYLSADYRGGGGWSTDGVFGAMVDSRQVHKVHVPWLLLLLAVYLLIIGPLDRWWLKKINRPMLTWITFPCYVALFSALVYLIGHKLRAGETEWNELHVVDVLPEGDSAELRGWTFASVYSPANHSYAVQAPETFAAFRGEHREYRGGSDDRSTVLQTGDSFKADLFVPVWTSQLYVNDWWQPVESPLTFRIARRGEGWEAMVENRLDRALTNARLVVADTVFELGELPAGHATTYSLVAGQGRRLHDFLAQFAGGFQNAAQARRQVLGSSVWISDLPNASQAASFASPRWSVGHGFSAFTAPPGLDLSSVLDRGQAILLAWDAHSAPVAALNQFKPRRSDRNTLYRISSPIRERN